MSESPLQIQYQSLEQQGHAARLGMWLVLVSEILLFSALFALYASYRVRYGALFAQAAGHTAFWMGAVMTYVLLASSLLVALAVHAVRHGRPGACGRWLTGALLLGSGFLALKLWEWVRHLREGLAPGVHYDFPALPDAGAQVFFTLYYLMTGLHALHVAVGLVVLAGLVWAVRRRRYDARYHTPVELGGMYWHLVDALWMFLWPIFYLMR